MLLTGNDIVQIVTVICVTAACITGMYLCLRAGDAK